MATQTQGGARDRAELRREVESTRWWHTIDLGDGIVTPGEGGSAALLERMHMPEDLSGKTVLDIGTFDGFFAFEAERRGAARVLAIDHREPPGFRIAHRALGSGVEFREMDVMDLSRDEIGTFDVVFFLGVVYHLRDPVGALTRVRDVTGELMILETEGALAWIAEPAVRFVGSHAALTDGALNWWYPNMEALLAMIHAAGFRDAERVYGPPPAPTSLAGRVLRRLRRRHYASYSPRLVAHARP